VSTTLVENEQKQDNHTGTAV